VSGRIVGIDLGTTNSLVALVDGDRPRVIPDAEGRRLIPSVVSFKGDTILVGEAAKAWKGEDVEHTLFSVKRLMGKGYDDVKDELRYIPYALSPDSREVVRIRVDDRVVTPPEVSAHVLRKLKRQAEASLGEQVSRAVITVPAHFDDSQRQATKDAGKIAGLEVMRIINEPTAAALAYGLDRRAEGNIAVYDLGGGTFDVSILKLREGIFEVRATGGDSHLGGDDFDQALMEVVLTETMAAHGKRLERTPLLSERVRRACEKAKFDLSDRDETEIVVDLPEEGGIHRRSLTRMEFEEIISSLVEKTIVPCRQALRDAGLRPEEIDEVVLVGGSTRVPLVRRRVAEVFGRAPHTEIDPDEVVALGAAIQGQILEGRRKDILLLDVIPLSLGIETFGGVMTRIVDRNTTVPVSVTEVFTTYVDGQTIVNMHVLQGEREKVEDNRSLARFQLKGLESLPAGIPKIEVQFQVDVDGLLQVTARDTRTGHSQSVEVKPTYGLREEEVDRIIVDSMEHAAEDLAARQLIESRNEADTVLRAAEKALAEFGRLVDDAERKEIEDAVAGLKASRATEDHRRIRSDIRALDAAAKPLADRMMSRALGEEIQKRKIEELP
jgi:Fe-S protein assembly chaperone HscA